MASTTAKLDAMKVGDKIWSSLSTWFSYEDETELNKTEYPMNATQIKLNVIEGTVRHNWKRKLDVDYPGMEHGTIQHLKKDLPNQAHFFSLEDLPPGSRVARSEEEIDFLVSLAPPLLSGASNEDQIATFAAREKVYKAELKRRWQEMQEFALAGAEIVPEATLLEKLPAIMKVPVHSRKDLAMLKFSVRDSLEEDRKILLTKLSLNTFSCNNLHDFNSFRIDVIENLNRILRKAKKDAQIEFTLQMPLRFVEHILVPTILLTGVFQHSKNSLPSSGEYHMHQFKGKLDGLKKIGIASSAHPRWMHPFIAVSYASSEIAVLGQFYDAVIQNNGKLPFAINPDQLLKENPTEWMVPESILRSELGDDYAYESGPHKIAHDIMLERLKAPVSSLQRNFGMTAVKMLSPKSDELVIDIVRPSDASSTLKLILSGFVVCAGFSTAIDIESNVLAELISDRAGKCC